MARIGDPRPVSAAFIDLKSILQRTVCDGYGDLVTRPTGQAVRYGVEEDLAIIESGRVAIIDFSSVRCLDFSCADEIIGKLLLTHGTSRYFLLRGVTEIHGEAIHAVLERYGIAVVAEQRDGNVEVLGPVSDAIRKTVKVLTKEGSVSVDEVAGHLEIPAAHARETLDEVIERRLALTHADDRVSSLT